MASLRAWVALATAALLCAGCITDPTARLVRDAQPVFTVIPLRPPSVFLSSDFFRGHRRDPEMGRMLGARIERSLEERGFRVVDSPADADYRLSTDLRGWWARSARFALITTATLTVYTPLDYKWILDVDLTDGEGTPVGSFSERGRFRFETFGIVFFPATIYAYYELVLPHWKEIGLAAAERSADYLAKKLGSPSAAAPDGGSGAAR